MVRGRRFVHASLGIAFEVPTGFSIENTRNAVLGTTNEGSRRLLFDQVESQTGQGLDEVLKATWNDALESSSIENRIVNGRPAVFAVSKGKDWTFRLAAIRVGENTFRMIMAAKGGTDPEPAFQRWIDSLSSVDAEEARALKPLHIQVVTAAPGETIETLSRRMVVPDRPYERFLALNGLDQVAGVKAGQSYKIVVE